MSQALQQYIDVIMDYDLVINYRPGLLHIVPDALSRMYTNAYNDENKVWGTVPNLEFINNFAKISSPSDFLCQQSINDITPLHVLRKRHEPTSKVGEGDDELTENNNIIVNSINIDAVIENSIHKTNKTQQTPTHATVSYCTKPTATTLDAQNNAVTQPYYQFKTNDQCESLCNARITIGEQYEFDHATLSAPWFSQDSEHVIRQGTAIVNKINHVEFSRDVLDEAEAEEARQQAYELEHNITTSHQPSTTSSADSTIRPAKNDLTTSEDMSEELLSEEEKLLVAQAKRGRFIPSPARRTKIVQDAHMRGHFGEKAMYAYIDRENHWWPGVREDIKKEIKECADCQRFSAYQFGFEPARSITASLPGDHLQVDLAQLPKSVDGHNYILIVVDVFTGFALLKPLKEKTGTAAAFAIWGILCTIGLPKILQSDNGTEFKNELLSTLLRITGVEQRFISSYNPRSDGKVERTVQTVKNTIVKLLQGHTSLWPLFVPFVQLMYNTKVQALTGSSPFCLMFGRKLNELRDYTNIPYEPITHESWQQHQDKIVSLILPQINKRINEKKTEQRTALDKTRKTLVHTKLIPGSIVMIPDPLYLVNPAMRPSTTPKFVGPYTVVRRTLNGPYVLRDGTGAPLDRHINIDQMKILLRAGEKPPRKPLAEQQEHEHATTESYIIEEVVDNKVVRGEQKYLVKWKDYPASENTWEPIHHFNDYGCIEKYWKNKIIAQQREAINNNAPNVAHIIYTHRN